MEKILAVAAGATMGILALIFLMMGVLGYVVFPQQAQMIGVAFLIVGAVFVLMMLVLMRMASRYRANARQIITDGRKGQASIVEIRQNTEITINNKHPYVLICEAEGRTFESEYFYDDVHRFDQKEIINVYLDDQTGDYLIDLES